MAHHRRHRRGHHRRPPPGQAQAVATGYRQAQLRQLQGRRTGPARPAGSDEVAMLPRAFACICQGIVMLIGLAVMARRRWFRP